MMKRLLLILGLLFVGIVGVIFWNALGRSQRTFNGKPESYWIDSLAGGFNPTVDEEWRALGSQGVPILLEALDMQPGPLGKAYFKLWPKLPARLHKLLPPPVDYVRIRASAWGRLARPGTKANISLSHVDPALKDTDWGVRMNTLVCLGRVVLPNSEVGKDQFLAVIIGVAEDPRMEVRMSAVACLGHYTNRTDLVIPALSNALADPYPDVRIRAAMALYKVDPQAAERLGALTVAYDCLKSSGVFGSGRLAEQFLSKLGKLPP